MSAPQRMNPTFPVRRVLALTGLLSWACRADTLKLEDGTVLRGSFAGGTPNLIRFETREGVQTILRAKAQILTFSDGEDVVSGAGTLGGLSPEATGRTGGRIVGGPVAARGEGGLLAGRNTDGPADAAVGRQPTRAVRAPVRTGSGERPLDALRAEQPGISVPAPASAVTPGLVVPQGSLLTVKLDTPITSETATGRKFSGKLMTDLQVGPDLAARAGTVVYGEVGETKSAGRLLGKSKINVALTGIDYSGTLVAIATTNHEETGEGSTRKTARNLAVGAIVGEATDNNAGAGAGVGLGTGLLREGEGLSIPAGTILDFELTQPFTTPGTGH